MKKPRLDTELLARFKSLQTPHDVALFLGVEYGSLIYHTRIVSENKKYVSFQIPKKSGGVRTIETPATVLKIIQQRLNLVLQKTFVPRSCVYGFVKTKNIVENAKVHLGQRHLLNIDLENFFPSIHFGRVRGIFMHFPFNIAEPAATILAQICCYKGKLPQGAPTSPTISNIICTKLDSELLRFARVNRCNYSRYADDLTFSTSLRECPSALAVVKTQIDSRKTIVLGEELKSIIENNKFVINNGKLTLKTYFQRQEVTGLVVNTRINKTRPNVDRKFIRKVRAMLHDWKIHGYLAAERVYFEKYEFRLRNQLNTKPTFKQIVAGKINFIGMVRGTQDKCYIKFRKEIENLYSAIIQKIRQEIGVNLLVVTEGKTDWKHLKKALEVFKRNGLFTDLDLSFWEFEASMGDTLLGNACRSIKTYRNARKFVFMFDRDNEHVSREFGDDVNKYRKWGNNVYSLTIPSAPHRPSSSLLSLELVYKDADLKKKDDNGRRVYLSDEFDPRSGHHNTEPLYRQDTAILKRGYQCIIDDKVFDDQRKNVALSKNDFANYVQEAIPPFDSMDFVEFKSIFETLLLIQNSV